MAASSSHQRKLKKEMNRQRRMWRTLLGLIVSMTVGGAFLDWLQPVRSMAQPSGTELMGRLTASLRLSAGASAAEPHWRAIYIASEPNDSGEGGEGIKRGQADRATGCHLVIDRGGRWSIDGRPRIPALPGFEGVLRIGLLAGPQGNEITPAQRAATRELVYLLQQEWDIAGQHVVVDDTLADPQLPVPEPASDRPNPETSSSAD